MVILSCDNDTANVDESIIDGKAKLRQKFPAVEHYDLDNLNFLKGTIRCSQPKDSFNNFKGYLEYSGGEEKITKSNLIYRGSMVKSTDFVTGICLFVGKDTYIFQTTAESIVKKKPTVLTQSLNMRIKLIIVLYFCIVTLFALR
jgi:hypothetical protein